MRDAGEFYSRRTCLLKKCTTCRVQRPLKLFSFYRTRNRHSAECRFCHRERNNRRNRMLRVAVLRHYCGDRDPFCACCGEKFLEFLSLDHIHGGGREQRKKIKIRWWEWVRKNGYPKTFRVLCHNCNMAIGLYGYCPHKQRQSKLHRAFASYDPHAPKRTQKLNPKAVIRIRNLAASGIPQFAIAREFRVSRATVCFVLKKKRWGDV